MQSRQGRGLCYFIADARKTTVCAAIADRNISAQRQKIFIAFGHVFLKKAFHRFDGTRRVGRTAAQSRAGRNIFFNEQRESIVCIRRGFAVEPNGADGKIFFLIFAVKGGSKRTIHMKGKILGRCKAYAFNNIRRESDKRIERVIPVFPFAGYMQI